jgi:hypothetical protein
MHSDHIVLDLYVLSVVAVSGRPRIQVNAETLWQVMSAGSGVTDDNDGDREGNQFSLSDLMLNLAQVTMWALSLVILPSD